MAGLVEVVAVPRAVFLLSRGPDHRSVRNIAMTVAASIPLVLVVAVLAFGFWHFG